jgi:ribosomal protein S27AE
MFVLVGGLESIVYLMLSFVAVAFAGYGYIQGKKAISKVAKDSKISEVHDDISLLKTMLTHVECPNCDGNIDLAEVGEDRIYHCGYCGASGIVEITYTGKM